MILAALWVLLSLSGAPATQQAFPDRVAEANFKQVPTASLPELLRERLRYVEGMYMNRGLSRDRRTLPESLEVARVDLNGDGVDEFVVRTPQVYSGGPLQHFFQRWSTHPNSAPGHPDSFQPVAYAQGSIYFGLRVNGYYQIVSQVHHPDRIVVDSESRSSRSRSNQYTRRLQRFESRGYQTVRLADYREVEPDGTLQYLGEPTFVFGESFPLRSDWRHILEPRACPVDSYCGRCVQELLVSKVPTANDASVRAWNARGFLDAISSWNVTALLRIAKDDETLGLAGSFVWEVRLTTSRGEGGATESVAWVGTQTGKVKIFP